MRRVVGVNARNSSGQAMPGEPHEIFDRIVGARVLWW
jgi:hypothetical protein